MERAAVEVKKHPCGAILSSFPSRQAARRLVKNPSSNSKNYRIELGTGEWEKEAFEKWQGSLQRYDNNIEFCSRDRQVFDIFVLCLAMEEARFRMSITSANFLQKLVWFKILFSNTDIAVI